jgi:OmpA-OmpF porin, OOP family
MKNLQIAGCCLALMMVASAHAEDQGPYVGIGAGVAHEGFTGFRGNDTAVKALAGYSFNRYFAAEVAYVDAGTLEDDVNGLDVAISSDGFIAAVLGKWPVNDAFSAYLKLGYASYDTRVTIANGPMPFAESSSESDLMFGGGLQFSFGDRFRLRAEMEKVKVSDADFRVYSLLATWQF